MIAVRCEDELMRREERNFALLRGIIVGINGEHMRGAVCRNNVVDNNLKLTRERAHRGLRMDVGNCRKHINTSHGQALANIFCRNMGKFWIRRLDRLAVDISDLRSNEGAR